MVYQDEITVTTDGNGHMHQLDQEVAGIVRRSGIRVGLVHLFHVGSTGAIGVIEFEPGFRTRFA